MLHTALRVSVVILKLVHPEHSHRTFLQNVLVVAITIVDVFSNLFTAVLYITYCQSIDCSALRYYSLLLVTCRLLTAAATRVLLVERRGNVESDTLCSKGSVSVFLVARDN
eukprot:12287-Heterococcus_DN1.PRE.6